MVGGFNSTQAHYRYISGIKLTNFEQFGILIKMLKAPRSTADTKSLNFREPFLPYLLALPKSIKMNKKYLVLYSMSKLLTIKSERKSNQESGVPY